MKINNTTANELTIVFSKDEFGVLRGALSEILFGFRCDVVALTGWTREAVMQLQKIIDAHYDTMGENTTFSFSKDEILFMMKVIKKTVQELEWELHARIGRSPAEAEKLLQDLQTAIAS